MKLKLSAPKRITWWIALVLAVLALLAHFGVIKGLSGDLAFYLALIAYVLLAVATTIKGL